MKHLSAFFIGTTSGGERIREREKRIRVNRMIRISEIRVIDEEGNQLGVMSPGDAMKIADERSLDLVEIAPNVRPPVCKIMDYGKYKYEQSKRARESKKKQHVTHLKEIKLRPKIEEHDYQFKMRHAEKFLLNKDKVKFTVMFRGREMEHIELGENLLKRVVEDFSEIAVVERPPVRLGRIITLILGPRSDKKKGESKEHAKDKD